MGLFNRIFKCADEFPDVISSDVNFDFVCAVFVYPRFAGEYLVFVFVCCG